MAERRGAEFWREHLECWGRSGLTQGEYCARNEINLKAFERWRGKQLKGKVAATPELTLVPVKVGGAAPSETIRIHSPSGWRIELTGASEAKLAALLRALP